MATRLYAVEIDGTPVTVRAEVVVPSREDRALGDSEWVDVEAINGVRVEKLRFEVSDAEWEALEAAVIAAHFERRDAELAAR